MSKRLGKMSVLCAANVILVSVIVMFGNNSFAEAAGSAGSSTVISAVIAPVRYIIIDQQQVIRQIYSNTTQTVVPVVYENNFDSVPLPLTPTVSRQYEAIMATVNTRHTGVVYAAATTFSLTSWLRLSAYESLSSRLL